MITNDLLRQLPARLRAEVGVLRDLVLETEEDAETGDEIAEMLEQAADVAEELLRLRRRCFEAGIRMTEE